MILTLLRLPVIIEAGFPHKSFRFPTGLASVLYEVIPIKQLQRALQSISQRLQVAAITYGDELMASGVGF